MRETLICKDLVFTPMEIMKVAARRQLQVQHWYFVSDPRHVLCSKASRTLQPLNASLGAFGLFFFFKAPKLNTIEKKKKVVCVRVHIQ